MFRSSSASIVRGYEGTITYHALLGVERELDTSELYSCAFVEWNRVVRRHAAAERRRQRREAAR